MTSATSSSSDLKTVQWVELRKEEQNERLGFNIKGGSDFGRPVYIHIVERNSLADRKGLKSGDLILSANHINFKAIKHHEALKVLKSVGGVLLLEINSNSPMLASGSGSGGSSVGGPTSMMLGSFRGEYYTWVDRYGNEVPPPINNPSSMNQQNKRVLNIEINPGQNLGLMIRGGYEYGLGIYVTGVDPGSVAERAGLQRGDEVLEVNGRSFTTITHDKAVAILKSCRKMTLVASYIGKIPADNQILQQHSKEGLEDNMSNNDELIDLDTNLNLVTTATDSSSDFLLMKENSYETEEEIMLKDNMVLDFNEDFNQIDLEKTTGMIEEKARTVLTKSEHSRFTFYRLEYQQGFLPIQTFVRILLELLSTVEKYTLLTEVRELIRPSDLIQFDELIYNKHGFNNKKTNIRMFSEPENNQQIQQQRPIPMQPIQQTDIAEQPPLMLNPTGQAHSAPPTSLPVPVSSSCGYGKVSPSKNMRQISPHPVQQYSGSGSGGNELTYDQQQRSQLLISHDPVVAKMQQQQLVLQQQQPSANSTPTSCVRYKVRVQKTKPILGIAIEGGSNTPHRLPRVISVNTEGSAYGSNLKAGQVLLTVDGKKLDGLTHEEIARSILDSYVEMSKLYIEFVVVEAKSSFIQGGIPAGAQIPGGPLPPSSISSGG